MLKAELFTKCLDQYREILFEVSYFIISYKVVEMHKRRKLFFDCQVAQIYTKQMQPLNVAIHFQS